MEKNKNSSESGVFIWVSFLFLMFVWGSSFFLIKQGLKVFTPVEVASIRLTSAMVVMIGFAIPHLKKIKKEQFGHLFISSIIAMGAPAYLFAMAQTPGVGVSSSIAGVLNALTPMMTFIIGISFFNQKLTINKIIGLIMGFIGSATLILVNAKGEISLNAFGFFIVIATICYGTNTNYIKRFLSDVPSLHLSTVTVSMVGLMSLCILFSTDFLSKIQNNPNGQSGFIQVAILGVFGTAFSQIVFNKLLAQTSALFASSITYFIPIVAVLWGVFDGEVLLLWHYIGMLLIIGGVIVLNRKK